MSSFRCSPGLQSIGYVRGDFIPGLGPVLASGEEPVVRRVDMADVRPDRQKDGIFVEGLRGGGTSDAAGVLPAGVLGDGGALGGRGAGQEVGHTAREGVHVLGIEFPVALGGAFTSALPGFRIREALLLGAGESFLFDEEALTLIAAARLTESDDDGIQRRGAPGASGERRVAARKEYEVVEIGARKAQGFSGFEAEETAFSKFFSAVGAGGVATDPEHDNLIGAGLVLIAIGGGAPGLRPHRRLISLFGGRR